MFWVIIDLAVIISVVAEDISGDVVVSDDEVILV